MKLFDSKLQSIVKNVQINDAKINYSTCEFSGVWKFQLYVQSMRYGQVPMALDDNWSSPLVFQTSKNYSSAGLLSGSCSIWSSFNCPVVLNVETLVHTTTINSTHIYISVDERIKANRINVSQHCSLDGYVVLWQRRWYVQGLWINTKMPSNFSHQFSAATKLMVIFNCNAQFKVSRLKKSMRWGEYWSWLRLGLALKNLSSHLSFLLSSFSRAVWFSQCYWQDPSAEIHTWFVAIIEGLFLHRLEGYNAASYHIVES